MRRLLVLLLLLVAAPVWAIYGDGDCCSNPLACYDKASGVDCAFDYTLVITAQCQPTPEVPGTLVFLGVCTSTGPTPTPTETPPTATPTPTYGTGDCCQGSQGCYLKNFADCAEFYSPVLNASCQPPAATPGTLSQNGNCVPNGPTATPTPTPTPLVNVCCACSGPACYQATFNCLAQCPPVDNAVCLPPTTPGLLSSPGACATLTRTPSPTDTPAPATQTFTPTFTFTPSPTFTQSPAPTCPAICVIDGTVYRANGAVDANDTITIYSGLTKPTTLAGCVVNPMPPITTTTNAFGIVRTFRLPYGMPVSVTLANGGGAPVQTYVPYAPTATMPDFLTQTNADRMNGFSGLAPPDQPVDFNNQSMVNVHSVVLTPLHSWELGVPTGKALAFCSDCTATTPCAAGGSGALASYNGTQWNCAAAP